MKRAINYDASSPGTNAFIELIRGRTRRMLRRLRRRPIGHVGVSSITWAELQFGVARSSDPARNALALAHFLAPLDVRPFDDAAALAYGSLRDGLERSGQPIRPLDTLIAAHAVALAVTLVTNNTREFQRMPGLRVEDWTV